MNLERNLASTLSYLKPNESSGYRHPIEQHAWWEKAGLVSSGNPAQGRTASVIFWRGKIESGGISKLAGEKNVSSESTKQVTQALI